MKRDPKVCAQNGRLGGLANTKPKLEAHRIALAEAVYDMQSPTPLEFALQMLLESAGFEFNAQERFGRFIVDAWVFSHRLVFEADGDYWHQDKDREVRRDTYLMQRGVVAVVHLSDRDLKMWELR